LTVVSAQGPSRQRALSTLNRWQKRNVTPSAVDLIPAEHSKKRGKGTSKKYSCDFNRDDGWEVLRQAGFDSVRQVAIDDDWSALRFRRFEFIKQSKQ
jgi:hypothetical protein